MSREKTTELTTEDFNSSSLPFLSSFPTFQLKTLTLCNDVCLGMVHVNSPVIYSPSLLSSSSSSRPVSWTAASHITVADDFYVNIFIRFFFKELLVMQRDFRKFHFFFY